MNRNPVRTFIAVWAGSFCPFLIVRLLIPQTITISQFVVYPNDLFGLSILLCWSIQAIILSTFIKHSWRWVVYPIVFLIIFWPVPAFLWLILFSSNMYLIILVGWIYLAGLGQIIVIATRRLLFTKQVLAYTVAFAVFYAWTSTSYGLFYYTPVIRQMIPDASKLEVVRAAIDLIIWFMCWFVNTVSVWSLIQQGLRAEPLTLGEADYR